MLEDRGVKMGNYNFLITGHGRSGTRFLAHLMNESELWTVLHEPKPKIKVLSSDLEYQQHLEEAQATLNKDFYGEVNSMRRRVARDIKVAKCGVIIRHPVEIMLSVINRKGIHQQWIDELAESLVLIDELIEKGWPIIWFDWMTSDPEYTQKIIWEFGIRDVEVTEEMVLTRVNQTTNKKYNSLAELPRPMFEEYRQKSNWFVKKYIKKRKTLGMHRQFGGKKRNR